MSGRIRDTAIREMDGGFPGWEGLRSEKEGLEVRKDLDYSKGRRQSLVWGLENGRAGSDLSAQVKGHLGRKAPFHSKSHLLGMFAAGSHAG